ncbi:MAG: TIGR02450 family Trp-rich protein [Methylovulum miyakonense]|uniref:TIGR02450 family Trp-rich protein n=1 Tax=Methylovulum miyakonense TaxID=645578 RepID=UPI003BB5C1EC
MSSKWTALQPEHKEKHFWVTSLVNDGQEAIIACILEAVINRHEYQIDWRLLEDTSVWQTGWH